MVDQNRHPHGILHSLSPSLPLRCSHPFLPVRPTAKDGTRSAAAFPSSAWRRSLFWPLSVMSAGRQHKREGGASATADASASADASARGKAVLASRSSRIWLSWQGSRSDSGKKEPSKRGGAASLTGFKISRNNGKTGKKREAMMPRRRV